MSERKYKVWDKEDERFITPEVMEVEEIDVRLGKNGNVLYTFPYEGGYVTVIGNARFDIHFEEVE